MIGTRYMLEVRPRLPKALSGLDELANDLLYSWDTAVRRLFFRLDGELWEACGHNPKVFLRRISQDRLTHCAKDRTYLEDYTRVMSAYNTYHRTAPRYDIKEFLDPKEDLVAYFCAEFGFHESLPIYSGGLGILAGDHCKAASDIGIPFVAVGLLYRQGYFTQTIDGHGNQIAHYMTTDFDDLPVRPVTNSAGEEIRVEVRVRKRPVKLRVWETKCGHIRLFLLDSDLPENGDEDRSITHQLYGGGRDTRIQQEIVLGIGGVRAIEAMGLKPTVWHINEGHSAFQILERCRHHVAHGLDFDSALELVASHTVFTTHTPVAAGHDIFDHAMMEGYFDEFVRELGIDMGHFLGLGASPLNQGGFNQTALALRGSRFHNGVSRIHGDVASSMERYIWPQIPEKENPIGYVTNGVHVPTFLAPELATAFSMRMGAEWPSELLNRDFWDRIDNIPDHSFWSLRQSLKSELFAMVRRRLLLQYRRNGLSETHIDRLLRYIDPSRTDVLTVGFARRFATYKRATLLFKDPERLARLVRDANRPILFIFAGKAHPHDLPGQQLIQTIHQYAMDARFEGRIVLVEGYDLALARKLISGVDVWLNTPEYPLEASGTSGEKAGINGVLNLSVLDGWWGEGYDGANGWAIAPHDPQTDATYRDSEEANELLSLIEREVAPLYYDRGHHGYSEGWVRRSKNSIRSLITRYNAQRMVMDYVRDYYTPASRQGRALAERECAAASELSRWKRKILRIWPKVGLRRIDAPPRSIQAGDTLPIRVAANLDALNESDVIVECLVGTVDEENHFTVHERYPLAPAGRTKGGETLFTIDLAPPLPGLQHYQLRMRPSHSLLCHASETGCLIWL